MFYATYDQHFPSESEERAGYWVGFGKHCGDAMTHKILDHDTWKGSKYNVQVEWETGKITFEPLSIIAADDPVTCAAYAKENDLLTLEGWHRFRSLAKKDKGLARAIKKVRSGKSEDIKPTCLGTSSPETTWRPCNLTLRTKTVNGMMPLN